MARIYFDHNATTPLHPAARAAILEALDEAGNPSSLHAEGRRARDRVERARDQVAALVGATRDEIVLTSGGTEANNLAVRGLARRARERQPRRRLIVTSPVEHPSVDEVCAGLEADGFRRLQLGVDSDGRIDLDELARILSDEVALVTVQLANHEIGTLQPVAEMVALARRVGALLHTDAVQACGKIAVDARALGVDALTLSAHKLGGPKGVGALFVRSGVDFAPLLLGGHQERERRPGTENVAGVVGFGAAAAHAAPAAPALEALRDRFERGALALGARRHGGGAAPRVPTTSNVAFAGVDGELLMQALDLEGVAVSTGAACSSGSLEPSPVIARIGVGNPREALRVSFGRGNSADEVDELLRLLPPLLDRIRRA